MPQDPILAGMVAELATLGEWRTAHGPRHPSEPDSALASEIERFLTSYPFLRRDTSYVDFLEVYAGAALLYAEAIASDLPDRSYRVETANIEIFGFSHTVSLHLVDGDGRDEDLPIVDAEGFLQVAILNVTLYKVDASLPGDSMLFADKPIAYDATGTRPWGVYAKTIGPSDRGLLAGWSMPTYQRSWETFMAFLADVVTGDVLSPRHTPR